MVSGVLPLSNAAEFTASTAKSIDPKTRDAAEQFEALLLSQILRSAREASGTPGDSATEFAEQHLANCMAHNGGLGIASVISRGLSKTPGV